MDCSKVSKESLIKCIMENGGLSMASFCKEIRKRKELLDLLVEKTSFAPTESSVSFRCYLIRNGFTSMPKCMNCGKELKDAHKFCSRKCSNIFYSTNEETSQKKSDASKLAWDNRTQEEKEEIYNKVKNTFLERYGVDSNFKTADTIEKRRKTWLQKYGVEYAAQADEVKEKIKETCNEKYGGNAPTSSKEIIEKRQRNNREKYGVNEPSQTDEVKEKIKETCNEKYGVSCVLKADEVKEKIKDTMIARYGVEYPLQSDNIKDKMKRTCLKKYGVEHASQADEVKEKIKETCIERYDANCAFQSEQVKEKIKETCNKKYGGNGPMSSNEVREKSKKTCLEKYGVEYAALDPEIMNKIFSNSFAIKEFIYEGHKVKYMGYEKGLLEILFDEYGFDDIENDFKTLMSYNICYFNPLKNRECKYIPDIYVKSTNTFYEVKSTYYLDKDIKFDKTCNLKAKAVIDAGYNFVFVVSKDGKNFEYMDYNKLNELYNE